MTKGSGKPTAHPCPAGRGPGLFLVLLFTSLILHPSSFLHAGGSAGSTVMSFLRLEPAARQTAMGGAGAGLFQNLQSMSYNPALLGMLRRNEVIFSHANWLVDSRFQDAAFAYATRSNGAFGVRYKTLGYGAIDSYDAAGAALPSFRARDSLFAAGWGRRMTEWQDLCAGVTLRYASQDLGQASAGAFMADAGFAMLPLKERLNGALSFGLAVKNLGQDVKFDGSGEPLPLTLDAGFGWKDRAERYAFAADAHLPKRQDLYFSAGAQVRAAELLFLRAGYESGQAQGSGLRVGAGISFGDWELDYAWLPFGVFGDTHHASLLFRFGGPAETAYGAGLRALRRGRSAEAVLHFGRALEEDPSMEKAALSLKQAHKLLLQQKELREAP